MKKSSKTYSRNNNGPKTLPCVTPDTTLTSLLRQPSAITCCDRFDRNCVNIENTEPPIHTNYREFPNFLNHIKICSEIKLHDPTLLPTLQCTSRCIGRAQRWITGSQTFSIGTLGGWSTPLRSINRPRRTGTRIRNTLDNLDELYIIFFS